MTQNIEFAKNALREQAKAVETLADKIGENFLAAESLILETKGRVGISGMGKSGIIGKKIMATLASTGTTAYFMHPGEGFHGDLGMVHADDVVILISYSGETEEVVKLLPSLRNNKIIAMTKSKESTLGRAADVWLDISVEREVCPNNLAPTTSTLVNMALGDALAVSLIKSRDFKPMDFARYHPGGSLGRQLSLVRDTMTNNLAMVGPETPFHECLLAMTANRGGIAVVMDENGALIGIVTDGDIRRYQTEHQDMSRCQASDLMSINPKTVSEDATMEEAKRIMNETKVKALVVSDANNNPVGLVEIYN